MNEAVQMALSAVLALAVPLVVLWASFTEWRKSPKIGQVSRRIPTNFVVVSVRPTPHPSHKG